MTYYRMIIDLLSINLDKMDVYAMISLILVVHYEEPTWLGELENENGRGALDKPEKAF